MSEINLLENYPKSNRPIEERAKLITEENKRIARQFGEAYFDGDRIHGYGGYNYDPKFWKPVLPSFQNHYGLTCNSHILDIGCAKGFMLHDFKELIPDITIAGIDISKYAIEHAIETINPFLLVGNAKELPYKDRSFDLVISINTIHNLPIEECKQALREIQRVSKKHSFVTVDAWRNDEEKKRLMKWNLTALTYMHVENWKKLFAEVDYDGDYFWFIAE